MKQVVAPSEAVVRMVIRFPASMKERLAEAAAANHRSMNSEIISILERALAPVTEVSQEDSK